MHMAAARRVRLRAIIALVVVVGACVSDGAVPSADRNPGAPTVQSPRVTAASSQCEERNRTSPPDWEGAPVPQDLYLDGTKIASVPRSDVTFYPDICFDPSLALMPVCEVLWNLDDSNGAVAHGYQPIGDAVGDGEFIVPLPTNWAEVALQFPKSCWAEVSK